MDTDVIFTSLYCITIILAMVLPPISIILIIYFLISMNKKKTREKEQMEREEQNKIKGEFLDILEGFVNKNKDGK